MRATLFFPAVLIPVTAGVLLLSCKKETPAPASIDYRNVAVGKYIGTLTTSSVSPSGTVTTTEADTIMLFKLNNEAEGMYTKGTMGYNYILEPDYTLLKTGSPLSTGSSGAVNGVGTTSISLDLFSSSTPLPGYGVYMHFTGAKQH